MIIKRDNLLVVRDSIENNKFEPCPAKEKRKNTGGKRQNVQYIKRTNILPSTRRVLISSLPFNINNINDNLS